MLANPTGKLHQLTTQLLIEKRYEAALERGVKNYQIRQYNISQLTPQKILQMYTTLTTKFYFNRVSGNNQSWYQNELRIYIWLLVGYSYLKNLCISKMNETHWKIFSEIFNERNPEMLQFQALTILKRETKCLKWSNDEVSLLDSIIKVKIIKNKWNEIAKELFIRSSKRFFRTAKKCREYWINHLDPIPVRRNWTALEDYNLVETVRQLGKRWSKVSKQLGGRRTEHMVKNRFKSLYHFQSKKINSCDNGIISEEEVLQILSKKLKLNLEQEQSPSVWSQKLSEEISQPELERKKQSAEGVHLQKVQTRASLDPEDQHLSSHFAVEEMVGPNQIKCQKIFDNSPRPAVDHFMEDMPSPRPFSLQDCFKTFFDDPDQELGHENDHFL